MRGGQQGAFGPLPERLSDFAGAADEQPLAGLGEGHGGEQRLSNFLLWQSAYSELYFSDRLWPDFDEAALDEALAAYAARERRFGQTSEQVAGASATG